MPYIMQIDAIMVYPGRNIRNSAIRICSCWSDCQTSTLPLYSPVARDSLGLKRRDRTHLSLAKGEGALIFM